jgi:hypothetical protein
MQAIALSLIMTLSGISAVSADMVTLQAKEPAIIREVTSKTPDSITRHYSFSSPVRFVDIEMQYSSDHQRLAAAEIRYGNGKRIGIPSALLSCFPDPHPEFLDFLFLAVDSRYPKRSDPWWTSLLIPFGHELAEETGNENEQNPVVPLHVYPYLEIELTDWKPSRVIIHRGPKEVRVSRLSAGSCPNDDIEWAIGAKK